jgi:hypothetical protein
MQPLPLDTSILPPWIDEVGLKRDQDRVILTMLAQANGDVLGVDAEVEADAFDDTFWVRYAEPMVNCLGGALFEAEHPGKTMPSFRWEALSWNGQTITAEQAAIIKRRKELTWTSPIRVMPD